MVLRKCRSIVKHFEGQKGANLFCRVVCCITFALVWVHLGTKGYLGRGETLNKQTESLIVTAVDLLHYRQTRCSIHSLGGFVRSYILDT